MADFCGQCTRDVLGERPELNDFAGICIEGAVRRVLCEGCGQTTVNFLGMCQSEQCETHPYVNQIVRGLRDENLNGHADTAGMRGE